MYEYSEIAGSPQGSPHPSLSGGEPNLHHHLYLAHKLLLETTSLVA
jgi:hypothetical protein